MKTTSCSNIRGIKYFGLVETWRQSEEPQPMSVIFILDNVKMNEYSAAREALHRKYGGYSFESMCTRHKDKTDKSLLIEAKFTDSMKRRQAIAETLTNGSKLIVGGSTVGMRAVPIIPSMTTLIVYKIKDLPSQSAEDACSVVSNAVVRRFSKLCLGRGWDPHTLQDRLVDIVPGYERRAGCFMEDGTNMVEVFTGTVYVVVRSNSDLGKAPYFKAYGTTVFPNSQTKHYIYCKRCKMVDSHDIEDCPLPIPATNNHNA
ncbi:hypothetical protein BJV82DRAFT_589513 [Fennellomyces sp. T-0311]|nr:hypothetical protein BJV82DRAFT_589513 [Fennellomyces sp. T-0311]